jgi:hypothetical protein
LGYTLKLKYKMITETNTTVEIGDVYKVIIVHRRKARNVLVKVLPNTGCVFGPKCMIVGGETTKLLHNGLIKCIDQVRFKEENKLPHLKNTVFEY